MVSHITYRPFDEDDFEELAAIIQAEWHTDMPLSEANALAARNDLAHMLSIASFSQVALVDGTARGIVLARPDAARATESSRWLKISESYLRRLRELDPISAMAHQSTFELTKAKNGRMLKASGFADGAEISLLAVSGEARGLGLGGVLIDAACAYLVDRGARKAFLYTDTDCSWQFYEHRGFKRLGSYRSVREERRLLPKELYLYGINLNE